MQIVELKKHEVSYAISEEIKYLRANIMFSGMDKKVILITSCRDGEGKSTLALQLARSLSEIGKRVLLIDTDLRRSVMKKNLKKKELELKGLTHFLSGMAQIEEIIVMTDEPVFYMTFAGPVPPNPSELLGSRHFDAMIKWARDNFDYVLIDSAPLGMVIDSAVIAPKCDGAILVIESGKVPYSVAQKVVRQLKGANCQVLGAVLNKVDEGAGNHYYNRYYKKY